MSLDDTGISAVDAKPAALKRELWLRDDCKKVLKAAEVFDSRNVNFQVECRTCKTILAAGLPEADGSLVLECACTRRVMQDMRNR